jgi:glutaredoxin
MNLRPPPFVMDVDTRDDVEVLAPLLARLTGQSDLPVLLVGGRPVGSVARIREMVANGELERLVKASGAVVGGGKRRKHA